MRSKLDWKPIEDFENKYFINSDGQIKAVINGKEYLKVPTLNKKRKYFYVMLEGKKRKNLLVHRLVAKAFIPNPNNLPEVNHKDFNRGNNKVNNLEWCTRKQNRNHSEKMGRYVQLRGEDCSQSKLTEKQVISIKNERKLFKTKYLDLAIKYGVKYSTIAHIMRGSRWSHV